MKNIMKCSCAAKSLLNAVQRWYHNLDQWARYRNGVSPEQHRPASFQSLDKNIHLVGIFFPSYNRIIFILTSLFKDDEEKKVLQAGGKVRKLQGGSLLR